MRFIFGLLVAIAATQVQAAIYSVNFSLSDGGTGSGTFDYASGIYSNINIVTTAGTILPGYPYVSPTNNLPSTATLFSQRAYTGGASGFGGFVLLQFAGAGLTGIAGDSGTIQSPSTGEWICNNSNCNDTGSRRLISSGTFQAAVPIPAAAWLFGSGLLGLGLIKRKRS